MDRIVELVEKFEHRGPADPERLREDARALVTEVLSFHAEGLRKLLQLVDRTAPTILEEAANDPLIASLLDLHGLSSSPAASPPSSALVPASSLVRKGKTAGAHDAMRIGRGETPKNGASRETVSVFHGDDEKEAEKETCELCGAIAGARHPHVVDLASGALRCACRACALLFEGREIGAELVAEERNAHARKYRRVPYDVIRASTLAADDGWWAAVGLPIGVAFFVRSAKGGASARYPGPAGATESPVPAATWDAVVAGHPALAALVPEVQALLVNRMDGAREHWLVGVDRCYELVGRVRERWRGLTGGDDVRAELARFFADLAREAGPS